MNPPETVNPCPYTTDPTPEEIEGFKRITQRMAAIYERLEGIDVQRQIWQMQLWQKINNERKRQNG